MGLHRDGQRRLFQQGGVPAPPGSLPAPLGEAGSSVIMLGWLLRSAWYYNSMAEGAPSFEAHGGAVPAVREPLRATGPRPVELPHRAAFPQRSASPPAALPSPPSPSPTPQHTAQQRSAGWTAALPSCPAGWLPPVCPPAAGPQVHPQLLLRLRDAQGGALVQHGDGRGGHPHRREHHQGV